MQKITAKKLYAKIPCDPYQTEEMKARFSGYLGEGKTPIEILKDPDFPVAADQNMADDKIWLVTHFLSDRTNRLFAVACCRAIWHLIEHADSRTAVDVAEKFANGEATAEELDAAWDAAWAAPLDAARDAAWAAARAAAWDAARAAAWDAACAFDLQFHL